MPSYYIDNVNGNDAHTGLSGYYLNYFELIGDYKLDTWLEFQHNFYYCVNEVAIKFELTSYEADAVVYIDPVPVIGASRNYD